jgi:hypothetical protein
LDCSPDRDRTVLFLALQTPREAIDHRAARLGLGDGMNSSTSLNLGFRITIKS